MGRLWSSCLLLFAFRAYPCTAKLLRGGTTRSGVSSKSFLRGGANAATSWQCVGDASNRTCLFKNLYYGRTGAGNSDFVMFLPQGQAMPDPVHRADKYEGPWTPRAKFFADAKDIDNHLASKALLEQPGLSLQFNPLFHQNIGHALFDGLYPAYMALVKLGLQAKDFRPVVAVDSACFDSGSPPETGKLKPGEIVEAYLPHPRYNKTLQPYKVEILQVMDKSGEALNDTAGSNAPCNFEAGLDSSAIDLGSTPVSDGTQGQDECCKTCDQTFGCTSGVIFSNTCYLKGSCAKGNCDHPAQERLSCRLKGGLRPHVDLSVRHTANSAGLAQESTIPMSWVVGRVRRRCMSEGIYETFGKSKSMLRLFEMERNIRSNPDLLYRFDEIAVGSGGVGNMIADESGGIGGSSPPLNAMTHFRDRMLEAYGLPVERGRTFVNASKPLDVMIVSNKRFTSDDHNELNSVIQAIRKKGDATIELIDWGQIGSPENRFYEHLKRVQRADIYVSSIGTALQYVPFMKDHKVYVALGSLWQRSNQLFPTFMEQQLAGGGTPYLRTLYADPGAALRNRKHEMIGEDGYRASVNASSLLGLLGKGVSLVREGFQIPVPVEDNLSEEGRVLVELCRQDPATCKLMQADRNGASYECGTVLWPECVVYEVGPWRSKCNLNRPLLRQLRKQHGLFTYGAPEM